MKRIICFSCKKPILKKGNLATDLHWLLVKPYHYRKCWDTYGFFEMLPLRYISRRGFLMPFNTHLATFFAVILGGLGAFFLIGMIRPFFFSLSLRSLGLPLPNDFWIVLLFLLFSLLCLHYAFSRLYSYYRYERNFR